VYQISVYLHILAAIVWIGGMLFLGLVVVPATRGLPPPERGRLFVAVGRRFRAVGWVAIAVLLVTGVVNLRERGVTWHAFTSGQLWDSRFGQILAVKLALVAIMIALSLFHDFVLGPRLTRVLTHPGPDAALAAANLRRRTSWLARLSTLLGLLVVAAAVALVRGLPW
jgi:uncharacterized membrane protein